jgi:hypothetical protein
LYGYSVYYQAKCEFTIVLLFELQNRFVYHFRLRSQVVKGRRGMRRLVAAAAAAVVKAKVLPPEKEKERRSRLGDNYAAFLYVEPKM